MTSGQFQSGADHNPTGKYDDNCCFISYSSVSWISYLLDGNVPPGLEDRTGEYGTYPAGGKYLDFVEYLKKLPDCTKRAQLGRHLLAYVKARVKQQRYR